MIRLAVIGKDVSASESPSIHTFLMRRRFGRACTYEKISIPPARFSSQAEELFDRYDGLNVTIPFKSEILPHLKELKGDAAAFGAVNTVVTKTRSGYNTDGSGFMLMLANAGLEVKGRSVLVLGAGGAGRSCIYRLCKEGAEVFAFERDAARLRSVYEEFGTFTPLERVPDRAFDLVLNCTGVGMHETVGHIPSVTFESGETDTAERLLKSCGAAVDLIYAPARSQFLRAAESYGKPVCNGGAMLFYQAYLADCIFTDSAADAAEADRLWKEYREVSS